MASNTKKLKIRRAINKARAGKKRKNDNKNRGTTLPNLPLNKPTANEIAMKKAAGK